MTTQIDRIVKLRTHLDTCAKPFGDLDALRYMFDELLAILLDEPGETGETTEIEPKPLAHSKADLVYYQTENVELRIENAELRDRLERLEALAKMAYNSGLKTAAGIVERSGNNELVEEILEKMIRKEME
jgi:regulator of replication initiation timing